MSVFRDDAGTMATEEVEDMAQVSKLCAALEAVNHKRRKILEQMRSDEPLFTLGGDTSPFQNPSTAAKDDIMRQSTVSSLGSTRKRALLDFLDGLTDCMPSLLEVDHPCA